MAIVPQGTVSQEVAKQTLAQVVLDDAELFRPLAAIYKKNKVLSPAMKHSYFTGKPRAHNIVAQPF